MQRKYRADIDGLRAVAVLSILLFHLGILEFCGGFIGVDIFFVISGFLITGLLKKEIDTTGTINFKSFYARRIRRLFPALFVTLFLTTVMAALVLSPAHLKNFGGSLTSALASVSNINFWLEADYFDVSAKVKPLLHTWSLSIEEQFYLIWPATFIFTYRLKSNWLLYTVLIVSSSSSLFLSFIFSDGLVNTVTQYIPLATDWIANGRATIFFLIPFRIVEFAMGASLVWLVGYRINNKLIHNLLFCFGVTLIAYSVFFFTDKMLFPYYLALLPCTGTAFLIYSGENSAFSPLLNNKIFVGIGLISYSLYLVHWPVIVFWSYITGKVELIDQVEMTLVIFIMSYILYRFIECPFRYKKIDLAHATLKYTSIISVLILAGVGIHIQQNNGWTWRISSPVSFENIGDAAEFHKSFYGGAGYPYYGPVKTTMPPDIILVGDSHARHYAEGIYKEWAKPEGRALYMACGSSFLHLPSFTRTTVGFDWKKEIHLRMNTLLAFIDTAPSPPLVMMSHAWLPQTKLADILDEQGKRKHINIGVEEIILGIRSFKKRIGDCTLIVLGEVPGSASYNLYDIFSRPKFLFFPDFNQDDFLTTPAYDPSIQFNQRLSVAAQSTGDFIFLDPHEILCEDGMCKNTDSQNRLVYSDTAHLSKYGSRAIIKAFLPQLKKASDIHIVSRNL